MVYKKSNEPSVCHKLWSILWPLVQVCVLTIECLVHQCVPNTDIWGQWTCSCNCLQYLCLFRTAVEYNQNIHPKYTLSTTDVSSPKSTSFMSIFHIGSRFCFVPASFMSIHIQISIHNSEDACHIVGLRPLMIILNHGFLSSKIYSITPNRENFAFDGKQSTLFKSKLSCWVGTLVMFWVCLFDVVSRDRFPCTWFLVLLVWFEEEWNTSITKSQRFWWNANSPNNPFQDELLHPTLQNILHINEFTSSSFTCRLLICN